MYKELAAMVNNAPWAFDHPDEIDLREETRMWDENENEDFNLAKSLIRIKVKEIRLRALIEQLEENQEVR